MCVGFVIDSLLAHADVFTFELTPTPSGIRRASSAREDSKFSASAEQIVSRSATAFSFATKRDSLTLCAKDH
jgi:hypothetical protein